MTRAHASRRRRYRSTRRSARRSARPAPARARSCGTTRISGSTMYIEAVSGELGPGGLIGDALRETIASLERFSAA